MISARHSSNIALLHLIHIASTTLLMLRERFALAIGVVVGVAKID